MMRKLTMGALVLAMCCPAALADGLKMERVAGDAKWVAHLDVEVLLKSAIGKFILAEAEKKEGFIDGILKIREAFGFDPLSDVRGLTLYGKKVGGQGGVVLFHATANQDKLLAVLKLNDTHKEIAYGDRTLHQWTDPPKPAQEPGAEPTPGKTQFGTFYDDKTIVIASSLDLLKGAIDVLDGKADSLAKTTALSLLPKPAPGAFLIAAAQDIDLAAQANQPKTAMARNVTDAALQAGERDGALFASATLVTKTPEKAAQVRKVVQGLVAIAQMWMQEKPDAPVLGEKIEVGGTDNVVQLQMAVPTESLIQMLKYLAAQKNAAKASP
jgi:hypothetical protein